MSASATQIIISLSEQNLELIKENARLREELSKYQFAEPVKSKVATPKVAAIADPEKPTKKKLNMTVEGHAAHVSTGKKLAALNSIRKEFMENAKLNGEW
jgi:regulator of replication initiation timing